MRLISATVVSLVALAAPARAVEPSGEQIYKEMCARCHGPKGEGTKKYAHPLTGDWSVGRLAAVIDRTMPEEDPDKLDAAGSKRVAEFIYDAFYSPLAQARLNPPRVELARLTVKQYRNTIADLIGDFRPAARIDEKRGLHAEYFNSRNFQNRARLLDRVDPEVNFDFGKSGPDAQDAKTKFDPHQFSIRWEGSVLAPETGNYEFVVKTDHATRLWVNDAKKPLIDRWVKSGSDTEFRESIYLLAGRAYTLRLEFSKAKQGVDDSKKNPNPPARPASISLWWKRPNRPDEVIATRFLMPGRSPEVAVIDTPFPPDDRSFGWERGTTISREWDAATSVGAIEAASYVVARLPELANVPDGAKDRAPKLRDFAKKFTERAFRRPLTDEDQRLFIDRQFAATPDPELALKRIILLVLKSPRFLFPEVSGASEQFATASRLALVLWDSAPDKELLDAAAAGKLGTRAEVAKQAERMLTDPRARAKMREFLLTWLKVDQPKDLAKDVKRFPGFDPALAADLRSSLELFLDDVLWSDVSDFRQLLLSDELYLNGRLGRFYGAIAEKKPEPPPFGWLSPTPKPEPEMPFTKMKFETNQRAGVLTHPYMLAALAYTSESSPIHRGVFVGRGLLGIPIKPPMDAFTPLAPDLHPNLTTRERVSLQTKPDSCATCHGVMNPLGFALENFDAVGRYRDQEHGKRIDASGRYETRAGTTATFTGARELARFLADSPEVHAAFVTQLFHHLVKQAVRAYGINRPEELRKSFSANGFNTRKLVVEIAVTAAMEPRRH
jgi:Protein of unknown function (DUF1592)/Protein of unknown function (DUF1588)/PA14 domain/Cytochrome C oxidase, cbb3-type, subunit III